MAAAFGLKDILIKLIEAGCDPLYNADGETPLSLAARNNRLDIIKYLVETLKIDPNYTPKPIEQNPEHNLSFMFFNPKPMQKPLSALATAVRDGQKESIQLLLELGANITEQVENMLSECRDNQMDIEQLIKSKKLAPE